MQNGPSPTGSQPIPRNSGMIDVCILVPIHGMLFEYSCAQEDYLNIKGELVGAINNTYCI